LAFEKSDQVHRMGSDSVTTDIGSSRGFEEHPEVQGTFGQPPPGMSRRSWIQPEEANRNPGHHDLGNRP
jgi:hypothetical protein